MHVDRVQVNYPSGLHFYYVQPCLLLTRCDWKQVPSVTADGLALDSDKPYAVTRLFTPLPGHSELTAASSLLKLWTVLGETAWIYHISHTVIQDCHFHFFFEGWPIAAHVWSSNVTADGLAMQRRQAIYSNSDFYDLVSYWPQWVNR